MTADRIKALEDALGKMLHAVCGETGFAACVRMDAGYAYPWPALDEAEKDARAAIAASRAAPDCQQQDLVTAEMHRSFPEASDGRPMPAMGDDLMTAGLDADDARFVAVQLAQNGLMLVPVAALDLTHAPAVEPVKMTAQDAARVLLAAIQSKQIDPFDASDLVVEALAVKHAGNRGDAVAQLEIAEQFFAAALRAIGGDA